jgi:RHS repeat-associated protein
MNVSFDDLDVVHYKGNLMEENHYYPYGLTITTSYIGAIPNKNLLTGKPLEKQEFADGTGLDWYNFDVRPYDPQIGRWHNPDILADAAPNWSPYRYSFSDPANYTDESGMWEDDFGQGIDYDMAYEGGHWEITQPQNATEQ